MSYFTLLHFYSNVYYSQEPLATDEEMTPAPLVPPPLEHLSPTSAAPLGDSTGLNRDVSHSPFGLFTDLTFPTTLSKRNKGKRSKRMLGPKALQGLQVSSLVLMHTLSRS